jgi:hypothetical protein
MNDKVLVAVLDSLVSEFIIEEILTQLSKFTTNDFENAFANTLNDMKSLLVELSKPIKQVPSLKLVICPICFEQVSGTRFAPHLDKCMRGGKRGIKNIQYIGLPEEKKSKKVFIDPYPDSLIIRLKCKDGGI